MDEDHGVVLEELADDHGEDVGPDGAGDDEEGAGAAVQGHELLEPGHARGEDGAHAEAQGRGADLETKRKVKKKRSLKVDF